MTTGNEILTRFERYAPTSLAVAGDPVGIQLGDAYRPVDKILVTLDVRPETVAEAIASGAQMIFAHHPAVFRPIHDLDLAVPQNAMYAQILKHDLLVYGAHTNLDRVTDGMNDWLAQALALTQVKPFIASGEEANMGRIGQLPSPMTLETFAQYVRSVFHLQGLRIIANDLTRPIETVAILGGDGGKFYLDAKATGADVFVTGDVYYHTGHDMLAADMPVIDPGHHIEAIMKQHMTAKLNDWAKSEHWDTVAFASRLSTDPFTFLV